MVTRRAFLILAGKGAVCLGLSACGTANYAMKNINMIPTDVPQQPNSKVGEIQMLIQPHQSLGLDPTPAVCRGDISSFMVIFPKRLFGEYFPGRLRWSSWTIKDDQSEAFGQVIFSGMHPSGDYFGIMVIDGQVSSGQTALLSTTVDFIYSPFGKELAVEREKFLNEPAYRKQKIAEVNIDEEGNPFNIRSLTRVNDFSLVIKAWNQVKFPEGYLLSPFGVEEVALIRGINPQYKFFDKLVGTGKFTLYISPSPIGMAINNAAGVAMDLVRAARAPSKGWDYLSEVPSRRNMAFIMEYTLRLAEDEVKKRNSANAKLMESATRRSP